MINRVLHLILAGTYWDQFDRGEKTVEYRRNSLWLRERLKGRTIVCFHRGYTKKTIRFKIARVEYTPHIDQFEFTVGERVDLSAAEPPRY